MLDSILLDQYGIPSVPIVTTVFENSVRALARAQDYTAYPLVVIKHPVAYVDDAQLMERAQDVVEQAVRILLAR